MSKFDHPPLFQPVSKIFSTPPLLSTPHIPKISTPTSILTIRSLTPPTHSAGLQPAGLQIGAYSQIHSAQRAHQSIILLTVENPHQQVTDDMDVQTLWTKSCALCSVHVDRVESLYNTGQQ